MCGIVGYIGAREAQRILLSGIKRLEYRGYDSAGIALVEDGEIVRTRVAGRVAALEEALEGRPSAAKIGIVHTRWATHGRPCEANAHPHLDCAGRIAVVHNGIIENFESLRERLRAEGHDFASETDTETIAHLIEKYHEGDLTKAVRKALKEVEGTYGLAILSLDEPDTLVVARNGSPVCIGVGDGEYVVASDPSAIIEHTRRIIFLDDHEIAALRTDGLRTFTIENVPTVKQVEEVKWDVGMLSTGGYETFMLKEIHEQPETIRNAFRGRLDVQGATARLGGLLALGRELSQTRKIVIAACGTALHAGMVGEYLLEEIARLPVEVEYASEFRYRNPVLEFGTVVIVISQSGETADSIAALREAKRRGVLVLAISNVIGSTIARESDAGVYIHAGPEIGVASTKAFTAQLTVLYLISLLFGRTRHIGAPEGLRMIRELEAIPEKVRSILARQDEVKEIARAFDDVESCLYLGRGYGYPVALEGALKLKEISYIHAEGYPAAEMKHGPIALVSPRVPSVVIATKSDVYDKVRGNIEEIKARGGPVIAIATQGDEEIRERADRVFWIPACPDSLMPILAVVPLQLLAYHVARNRGLDVDKPRNLAKSVTVE